MVKSNKQNILNKQKPVDFKRKFIYQLGFGLKKKTPDLPPFYLCRMAYAGLSSQYPSQIENKFECWKLPWHSMKKILASYIRSLLLEGFL